MSNGELVTREEPRFSVKAAMDTASDQVAVETALFELAQRKAQIYAKSSLVPKEYQNNVGNVLIAENMARRMGADTLMVMQNLYVVHGRPGWSAQFLIATFNSCGRFSAIRYRFSGEKGKPGWSCVAYAKELATGEVIEGTAITLEMAKAEGWSTKNGSKWMTIPEQMMRYRSATFLIRVTAPEIGMGLLTKDELEDMGPEHGGKADAVRARFAMRDLPVTNEGDELAMLTSDPQAEYVGEPVHAPTCREAIEAVLKSIAAADTVAAVESIVSDAKAQAEGSGWTEQQCSEGLAMVTEAAADRKAELLRKGK